MLEISLKHFQRVNRLLFFGFHLFQQAVPFLDEQLISDGWQVPHNDLDSLVKARGRLLVLSTVAEVSGLGDRLLNVVQQFRHLFLYYFE